MDSSRFIICRAAAGSGKTYTLVRQYLQLAFSAPESQLEQRFTHILAITFTNKAANEMKERILHELDNISEQGTHCSMGADIAQQLELTDTTLRQYASIVRQAILHNYSDFAVCTIDSFMHRIVRTFAHDLNLPLNFDVNVDKDDLVQHAIDELMALIGTEGQAELTKMVCEYAESQMNEGKNYKIEPSLTQLSDELFKERAGDFLDSLRNIEPSQFLDVQRQMSTANSHFKDSMHKLGNEGLSIIAEANLDIEDFFNGKNGAGAFFQKLINDEFKEPNKRTLEYLEGDKLGSSKCSPAKLESLRMVKPKLHEVYLRYKNLYNNEGLLYNTRCLLLRNIHSLALLNKLGDLVEHYAHDNEIVHISEFNKRIADVVRDEPAPFIYERLGNRYWNYLIDEFQDTSRMQWLNLVPLVENGVASNHTSLVVGDGKQAIYRFRQGDVEQFASLPHVESPLHGKMLEQPGVSTITHLDRNFRTGSNIVEFNNNFFEWVIRNRYDDNAKLKEIYLGESERPDLAQSPVKEGGYVQLGFWQLDEGHDLLWQEILGDIRQQIDTLGYSYRDITLLARDNHILSEISTFLTEHQVPVVSSESFLLTQSQVVMLLRSLMLYLIDGSNQVAAARVILYLRNLGIVQHDYSPDYINAGTGPMPKLDTLLEREGLTLRCDRLRQMGLYDCCEEAIRMLHLDGIETAYTASFLNVVAKYCTTHRQDLTEFIEWFDEKKNKLSTSTSTDLDAVRLMTIHKAKGLESPIILYPILNETNKPKTIWVHFDETTGLPLPAGLVPSKEELEPTLYTEENNDEVQKTDMDRVNLLYVALTRPKEKLLVYCQVNQTKKKSERPTYPNLLQDYLSTRSDMQEIRPQVYALGNDEHKKTTFEEPPATRNTQLTTLSYPDWTPRIAIADQSSELFGELDDTAKRRGIYLHELLALIHHRHEADSVLQDYLLHHPMPEDEATLLGDTLHNMMHQSDVARFFNPDNRCMNECSLVFQGEVLRPDRIVYTPTETWVIDFKSGTPRAEHRDQVSRYCQAISSITHSACVKGYLLYVGPDRCQVMDC